MASAPDQGTTFRILFPCAAANAPPARDSEVFPVAVGSETVLVVDDEAEVRNLAGEVLKGRGYHVLTASGASEALRVAAASGRKLDLLLTDVVMPGVSGTELARQLAAVCPGLKVLYMSGYSHEMLSVYGAAGPDVALVEKPFALSELAHKVREVLNAPRGGAVGTSEEAAPQRSAIAAEQGHSPARSAGA
jgi:DNA-binding NtrC family response regulator